MIEDVAICPQCYGKGSLPHRRVHLSEKETPPQLISMGIEGMPLVYAAEREACPLCKGKTKVEVSQAETFLNKHPEYTKWNPWGIALIAAVVVTAILLLTHLL